MRCCIKIAGLTLLAAVAGGFWWLVVAAPALPARPVVVLISGDTAGWILPCGCAVNQSGGLPRRGTHVAELAKRAAVLVVDAGGAPGGVSPYQRLKFEAILRGELAMGLAAHNLGGPEIALGVESLRHWMATLNVPFISANVYDAGHELVAPPVSVRDVEGRRIGLIGVVSSKFTGPGLTVADSHEAILNLLPRLQSRVDCVIVMAYAPEDELRRLASTLPEVDAVVGGPTGQSLPPERSGPTLVASATNKGKFLIELDIPARGARTPMSGRVVEMDGQYADHPKQMANIDRYLADLNRRSFTAQETGFVDPGPGRMPKEYRLAGSQTCAACHVKDCAVWKRSKHARAWETLVAKRFQGDGYCQQCHTTGFGLPGGFESAQRSVALRGVGCESCHGPSQMHSLDPKAHTPFSAGDQCIRCHDADNSPHFVYARYWSQIAHGAPAAARQGGERP